MNPKSAVEYVFLQDWGPVQKGRVVCLKGENAPHHVRGAFFVRTPKDAPEGFNAWDGTLRLRRSTIDRLVEDGIVELVR